MRAVVQRVSKAAVAVDGEEVARMRSGLLVLVGVAEGDGDAEADYIARKVAGLRIFEDDQGQMNLNLADVGGEVLVVSQFTLYGDCDKGRRPSFSHAAAPAEAERLYLLVADGLRRSGLPVQIGRFGANMDVTLTNAGPVTLILDTARES